MGIISSGTGSVPEANKMVAGGEAGEIIYIYSNFGIRVFLLTKDLDMARKKDSK